MKFIKQNLKVIIGFIIGVILTSGITVYAYSYIASDVKYTDDKSVADALNELYQKSYLLWENPDQNSAIFEETTIDIDLSNYSSVIILGKYSSYYNQYTGYIKINKGGNGTLQIAKANDSVLAQRSITVNNNSIVINNGYASDDTSSNYHFYALPMYIIGIK